MRSTTRIIQAAALAVLATLMGFPGPASANVSVVRNSCVAPSTVEIVTLSNNTYEYTFQQLPHGTAFVFAGIVNPTSTSYIRRFEVPPGSYRLTFRHPNTVPVGVYSQRVVIRPHHMVGGACVPVDSRALRRDPTAPVQ